MATSGTQVKRGFAAAVSSCAIHQVPTRRASAIMVTRGDIARYAVSHTRCCERKRLLLIPDSSCVPSCYRPMSFAHP